MPDQDAASPLHPSRPTDTHAIELIVEVLGREQQWSSDEIEQIADIIRRVRPTLDTSTFRYTKEPTAPRAAR